MHIYTSTHVTYIYTNMHTIYIYTNTNNTYTQRITSSSGLGIYAMNPLNLTASLMVIMLEYDD